MFSITSRFGTGFEEVDKTLEPAGLSGGHPFLDHVLDHSGQVRARDAHQLDTALVRLEGHEADDLIRDYINANEVRLSFNLSLVAFA